MVAAIQPPTPDRPHDRRTGPRIRVAGIPALALPRHWRSLPRRVNVQPPTVPPADRPARRPRSASARGADRPACAPPWDRSGTATTTPSARASSRPSSANSSTAGAGVLRQKLAWRSSPSSRDGTLCELLRGLWVESQANPRNRRCSAHDAGRSRIRFKRAAVNSTGWRPSRIASTMSGARKTSGITRLTSP